MSHPYHHALSSVKKYGGEVNDYIAIHNWFDQSKAFVGDFRHRALRHHAQGIFECEREFGLTITNSANRVVPVRFIAEQHVTEDLGFIPSLSDWLMHIKPEPWMNKNVTKLSKEFSKDFSKESSNDHVLCVEAEKRNDPHSSSQENG